MMLDEFRREMEAWWNVTDAKALAEKDSQQATLALITRFRGLPPDEGLLADEIIAEWVLSTEERKRFDALAVISMFGLRSAIPNLHVLQSQLARSDDAGAPFELKKVQRILDALC
jgi:hypothetical protein